MHEETRPTTQREKVQAASKARLLRAGNIATMIGMIKQHVVRERVTIEIPELKRWAHVQPHDTTPLLKGRRGKGTRRQRKAAKAKR